MLDALKIGERLKELRGNKTLAMVSHDTGVGVSALANYEAGLRVPRDEVKIRLARYYCTSVDELFFDEEVH